MSDGTSKKNISSLLVLKEVKTISLNSFFLGKECVKWIPFFNFLRKTNTSKIRKTTQNSFNLKEYPDFEKTNINTENNERESNGEKNSFFRKEKLFLVMITSKKRKPGIRRKNIVRKIIIKYCIDRVSASFQFCPLIFNIHRYYDIICKGFCSNQINIHQTFFNSKKM